MRLFIPLTFLCFAFFTTEAQKKDDDKNLASSLKFAIVFGEQIQMSEHYINTGAKGKKFISKIKFNTGRGGNPLLYTTRDAFNKGDKDFRKGKFRKAFQHYNEGFAVLQSLMSPRKTKAGNNLSTIDNIRRQQQNKPVRPMVEIVSANPTFTYFGQNDMWEYTRGLNAVAMYYQVKGNYQVAQNLYLKALTLRAEHFGKTSEPYVCTLSNLATLRKDQGNFAAAEDIMNYLLKFYKRAVGQDSREYVITLNNKAMLDAKLGRVKNAVKGLEEVQQINNESQIFGLLDLQRVRTNYALLLAENDVDKGISVLEDVKIKLEENNYSKHADYYIISILLGKLYLSNGSPEAIGLIDESMTKVTKSFGFENPLYLNMIGMKADFYLTNQDYSTALLQYNQMLPILENKFGIRNKFYLDILMKSAYCEWKVGDIDVSVAGFQKGISEYLKITDYLFRSMSEEEQSKFWRTLKPNIDLYYHFALENHREYPRLIEEAYNIQIKTKGLLLNNTTKTRALILKSGDKTLVRLYKQWIQKKKSMSRFYNMNQDDLSAQGIDLITLSDEINSLERKLVSRSESFNELTVGISDWTDVQSHLREGELAIEIIRMNPALINKDIVQYMALVLSSSGQPELVELSDGHKLEKEYISFYKNSVKFKIKDVNTYEWFWKPLEASARDYETLYISVDGVYNSLNLNTFQKESNEFLIDAYNIIYLSNTKFIGDYKTREADMNVFNTAVLVGNPEFGDDQFVSPLPGTLVEVELIGETLKTQGVGVTKYTGSDANRKSINAFGQSDIVHVATHGFFIETKQLRVPAFQDVVSETSVSPLFRSGLMLAGAGHAYKGGVLSVSDESIVTAFDVMNLELDKTKLVVLSACETGIGEVVNGEGVYGLLRSFQIAGADATIMSLWKVDDTATQNLMVDFYKLLIETGDLSGSFRTAQKNLRLKYPDPYYWGAFVLHP